MSEHLHPVSRCVDRSAIQLYAEITEDFNPIHVDPDFARQTPMGGIIAHGMLSLNFIWQSLRASLGDDFVDHADLRVRFVRPVRESDVVTAGGQRRSDDAGYDVWVRNQKGEDVIVGHVTCQGKAAP
ncbi:MaoC family dehydratase [Azospirillum sp.]|uniref:MaoC family dehydratase n=1 Tax=Azospirillum sp. TaxID=34012 RepID=UPI002D27CDB9|nr:MaoC family dehydratase [Azospirillum sp.]HYD71131.1 MaoC family dehydratase [Azospirillum sp.]HYH23205.1 MaoC family dehydratase [Azospirillum sp.]